MYYNKDSTNGCTALIDNVGEYLLSTLAVSSNSVQPFCNRLAYKDFTLVRTTVCFVLETRLCLNSSDMTSSFKCYLIQLQRNVALIISVKILYSWHEGMQQSNPENVVDIVMLILIDIKKFAMLKHLSGLRFSLPIV